MDSLPFHLLEEILFKLDPKSVAMMQCTDRSIKSHISGDPYFKSEYLSRLGPDLVHISTFGSNILLWHSSRSTRNKDPLKLVPRILDVANPLSKTLRFAHHSESKLEYWDKANRTEFAVDRTSKKFKIVCITAASNPDETMYQFEISTGESRWRLSGTTITCRSSLLVPDKKPVYFHGAVHWLRNDGSIVAFNPETEQARLIPNNLPQKQSSKITLAVKANKLTLITATEEVTDVFTLENNLTDPKWVLVKRIEKDRMRQWNVAAYDGECLVVREKKEERYNGVVHVYNLRPNKRFPSLTMVMKLICGFSPYALKLLLKKKTPLGKRFIREEYKMGLQQIINKRIRVK